MRAVRIHRTGGSDEMVVDDIADPIPGFGEVLVRLSGAGVNFIDVYHRTGLYPRQLPGTLGEEGAGVVVALGDGVNGIHVGQRVASANFAGSYAELATAAASRVAVVPAEICDEKAAASLLQGMTAHYLLHDSYHVRAGDTVLVHAAAGGMGLLLTQLATRMGARVIGTASTPAKADLARAAGATDVLEYDNIAEQVRDLTHGAGVAAAYDGVGQATFDASLASLRTHGVLVTYGQASGKVPPIDPLRLMGAGSVYVTRPTLTHFIVAPEEFARRAGAVLSWVAEGALDIKIGGKYGLEDAAAAHDDLEGRRTTGKLLLVP